MAIKALVDKLEDVDEKYRDLYTEKNGKFELTGVEGMKTEADITRLTTALEKERKDHKLTKGVWSVLGDRKPDDVIAILDRVPELEAAAAGKIDDVKLNELVEKRMVAKTGPLDRQIKTLTQQNTEFQTQIQGYQAKDVQRAMHDAIRDAFGKAKGIQATALEDALVQGERMLTVSEDGKIITKDGVGVTPGVDAVVWLTEMKEKRPHWWGPTEGGGANGSNGGGNNGSNPFANATWNMTEQSVIYKQNPTRAHALAKSAGTTVGGLKPPAPVRK